MEEPIISSDTRRANRLPPRQVLTRKWPVLHAGNVPPFDPATWDLTVFPIPFVDAVKRFTWPEFTALPRERVFSDMHCVTRWSLHDNLWGRRGDARTPQPRPRRTCGQVRHGALRIRLFHQPADRRLLRRGLPVRLEAQRAGPHTGARLPAEAGGAAALCLEERNGSAASSSWRPTGPASGRAGNTAATTCAAIRGQSTPAETVSVSASATSDFSSRGSLAQVPQVHGHGIARYHGKIDVIVLVRPAP